MTWGEQPDFEYDLRFNENCDTLIDGKVYKKLSYHNTTATEGYEIYNQLHKEGNVAGLLREEEGKIFHYSERTGKEYLLYDFTLNKGDAFTMEAIDDVGEYDCHVEDVSYITSNGVQLKRIQLSSLFTDYQYGEAEGPVITEWIEGFGGQTPVCQPLIEEMAFGSMDIMAYATFSDYTFLPREYNYQYFKGQQLVLGKEVTNETEMGVDDLKYEFTDDFKLHVYGILWTNKSPNQYIHCTLRQREYEPVYDITFDIDVLEPKSENTGAFLVDFYFDDFYIDPYHDQECHIHDSSGEHVLILKTQDTTFVPFVSSGAERNITIYDLQGRRLTEMKKGIYIQNGKIYIK